MPVLPLSLGFQRDVTAAALAIDAQQNFFVSFQFLADGEEILCVLDRLLGEGATAGTRESLSRIPV
jgi:hypothetical protein